MKKSIFYFLLGALVVSTVAFLKVEDRPVKTSEVDTFIEILNGTKAYTLEIAEAMPADKYTFKPHDSVRSFGEQLAHIGMSSKFLVSIFVNGDPMPGPEQFASMGAMEKEMGASKEACIKAINEAFDMIMTTYEGMSEEDMNATFKVAFDPNQPEFPKSKAFDFVNEHISHHRGQALVSLRMQGVKAPAYRLY